MARRGVVAKASEQIAFQNLRCLHRRHRLDVVVGGAKQDRAQAEKVARNLEVDDLARAVGQQLVGADPSVREDVGGRMGLALVDEIAPRDEAAAPPMQAVEDLEFGTGQGDEVAQLAGEGAMGAVDRTSLRDPCPGGNGHCRSRSHRRVR